MLFTSPTAKTRLKNSTSSITPRNVLLVVADLPIKAARLLFSGVPPASWPPCTVDATNAPFL